MPDLSETLTEANAPTLVELMEAAIDTGPVGPDGKPTGSAGQEEQASSSVLSMLQMMTTKDGTKAVRPTKRNAYLIISHDRRWKKKVWKDDFRNVLMLADQEYRDTDDTRIAIWLEKVYDMRLSTGLVTEVASLIGEERKRNPLIEWLDSCTWDGTPRISEWLIRGVGAADNELHRDVARRWLIQAVARAVQPGCKADTVLILIGKQGARKSTAFRTLAGEQYFCDTPMDIGSPNAYAQIQRTWIYEVAELDSIRKSANSATKAFLSAQEDTYRPAYGRHAVTKKRHCVFCGTTNEKSFISDMTGSRRFWPVEVGTVNLDWLNANREQLWAEAVVAYRNNESWWLQDDREDDLQQVSDEYRQQDPWEEILVVWMDTRYQSQVTTQEIMQEGLKLEPYQMSKPSEMRVGTIMRSLGYERVRKMHKGTRTYLWSKMGDVIEIDRPREVEDDASYF